jgi:Na+/H+ antiporter NhaD/arsenite permease-like protein
MGVDFLWTAWNLWLPWLAVNVVLLIIYYLWDRFISYPREPEANVRDDEAEVRQLRITGLWPNVLLLLGVIFSVALLAPDPNKPFPGTDWVPWMYLREVVQLGLVAASLLLGSRAVRMANKFNYRAIVEVAALFIGIFLCMQPAIEILNVRGPDLRINTPQRAFWATGGLSSVLDNAPTYVVFFKTAASQFDPWYAQEGARASRSFARQVSLTGENVNEVHYGGRRIAAAEVRATNRQAAAMLIGISLGAVFMGAMTYIGNGPNFMVRAIAEQAGVKMPSFFGYVLRYSIPVLIPVFVIATLVFL